MGIFGWLLTGAAIGLIWKYATENQWSNGKKWIGIIAVLFLSFCCSGNTLKSKGVEYVLDNLKSPSSADFLSYTDSKDVRKLIKKEYNIKYDKDCDIIMLEVEATNGFGGRVRDTYIVLFKDGEAIDMCDASNVNINTIRTVLRINQIDYETITD